MSSIFHFAVYGSRMVLKVHLQCHQAGNFCNQFISDFQGGPSRCLGHFEADDLGNIDFIPSQTTKVYEMYLSLILKPF